MKPSMPSIRRSMRRSRHDRRLEARPHEPVGALEQALGLGVARVQDDPAHGELAAEGDELLGGPAAR